jgi:multidrug efflux pump subunit AcrA (membrane-fusion protein)
MLALIVSVAACKGGGADDTDAGEAAAPKKVPVEVVDVERRDLRASIVSTSAVDSRQAVDIVAEIPGIVVDLDVEQGDTVKKGARLARVQREELNLGLETATSNVSRLEREVERLKPLFDKGIVSQQVYDEARYRLETAVAEQKRAKTASADMRVTSPIAGVVAIRHVNIGQQVATGTPLFRVVDPDDLIVHVNLTEQVLGDVFEGQAAYVASDALDGAEFSGTVEKISPVVDPRTGTVRVTIDLEELANDQAAADAKPSDTGADEAAPKADSSGKTRPAPRLRPGMFVKVNVVTSQRPDVLVVPRRAVVEVEGRKRVFVVTGETVEARDVDLGIAEGSVIEVTDGVEEGEQVVVLGQDGLKDGTPVVAEMRRGEDV